MSQQVVIACGGLKVAPVGAAETVLPLNLWASRKGKGNVFLRISDLYERLYRAVPKQFEDLLEIATYVYVTDQAIPRQAFDRQTVGASWHRDFHFHIPVRVPELWSSPAVKTALISTLRFLSEDDFEFTFYPASGAATLDRYFQGNLLEDRPGEPEQVAMFSGGLDSLAGAVEESVENKRRFMLVSHRPTPKLNGIQTRLEGMLAAKGGEYRPDHVHVEINKSRKLTKEYTQRTRSFLYVALGGTVAKMLGMRSVRFYENGVVSMNLPACAQVVGSKATRTTHPRTLRGYEQLLSAVAGETFTVENPFIWNTKGEILGKILKAKCGDLINSSVSCAHPWLFSNERTHCGTCSQCIDRRIAIVAAGAEGFDAAEHYRSDVFTGSREADKDRMMLATYLARASQFQKLKDADSLISEYSEVLRALRYLDGQPHAAAERVLTLHKRHAKEVTDAVELMLGREAKRIREHDLPSDCLLRIAYESGSRPASEAPPTSTVYQEQQEQRLLASRFSAGTYLLRKGHKTWTLVFNGEVEPLLDERAVELVNFILKHPEELPLHADGLEQRLDGAGVAIVHGGEQVVGGIQEAAGSKLMGGMGKLLLDKLRELREIRDDPDEAEKKRVAADTELRQLLKAYDKAGKSKGGARASGDRVRKNIRNFIDQMKKAETDGAPNAVLRAFGEHLEECLWSPSKGANGYGAIAPPGCYLYLAPGGIVWKG